MLTPPPKKLCEGKKDKKGRKKEKQVLVGVVGWKRGLLICFSEIINPDDCCRPCLPRLATPSQIRDGDSFIADLKLQEHQNVLFSRVLARQYWTIYQTVRPKREPNKRSVFRLTARSSHPSLKFLCQNDKLRLFHPFTPNHQATPTTHTHVQKKPRTSQVVFRYRMWEQHP